MTSILNVMAALVFGAGAALFILYVMGG